MPVTELAGIGSIKDAIHAALTATAHILVTRVGPPATRTPALHAFLDQGWRDDERRVAAHGARGRSPGVHPLVCPPSARRWVCALLRGPEGTDWLVEHDSHGQLLALIADYHRFTADGQFLEESWTFIDKAVGCIERLLGEDGLLPISVSHEGYLAQPVHSYWDDFWALRGLRDAVGLAQALPA